MLCVKDTYAYEYVKCYILFGKQQGTFTKVKISYTL